MSRCKNCYLCLEPPEVKPTNKTEFDWDYSDRPSREEKEKDSPPRTMTKYLFPLSGSFLHTNQFIFVIDLRISKV